MSEDVGEFWEKGVARRRGSQAPMKPKGTPPGAGTLHHVTHFNQRMQQVLPYASYVCLEHVEARISISLG